MSARAVFEIGTSDSSRDTSNLNARADDGDSADGERGQSEAISISDTASSSDLSAGEFDEDAIEDDDGLLASRPLHVAKPHAASEPLHAQDSDKDILEVALKYVFGLSTFRGDQRVRALLPLDGDKRSYDVKLAHTGLLCPRDHS
jgi:hypothetical protein